MKKGKLYRCTGCGEVYSYAYKICPGCKSPCQPIGANDPVSKDGDKSDVPSNLSTNVVTTEAGERTCLLLPGGEKMYFRWCSPGTFSLGNPASKHKVEFSDGFWIAETPVTCRQWKAVAGGALSSCDGEMPMTGVSLAACNEFVEILNRELLTSQVRLPFEAEWEYACRSGRDEYDLGALSPTDVMVCNLNASSVQRVAQKVPNLWGCYDMLGNVWEWCSDPFYEMPVFAKGRPIPRARKDVDLHVIRGGSFSSSCKDMCDGRTWAYRSSHDATTGSPSLGFRLVLLSGNPAVLKNPAQGKQPGEGMSVFLSNGVEMRFRWCPSGNFTMGSKGKFHAINVAKGFWLGETVVTQAQWESVMGNSNPSIKRQSDYPVTCVSFFDCQRFVKGLRKTLGFRCEIRLPTEAEWEYACRCGTAQEKQGGEFGGTGTLSEMGWYSDNSGGQLHAVCGKSPNQWGFYDMHGNVWEWCVEDVKKDSSTLVNGSLMQYQAAIYRTLTRAFQKEDAGKPKEHSTGCVRGGCFRSSDMNCRSAARSCRDFNAHDEDIGFRVAFAP